MSADANAPTSELFAQLQPGLRLAGCYQMEKRVEGTTQPLWLAQDEVLGKKIALHFLPPGALARSGVAERLRQEVKRARQFVNQRVVRVQELIEEEDFAAIAMESFAGRPLSAVVAANTHGFFEVAEVFPLVRELCETLTAAHRLNLAHGCLSLENVLVGEGQAKLMEFGVGASLREDGAPAPFASAQQLAGAPATPADDIFAMGALLHTVLTGAPPFEGADRKSAPSITEHRHQRKLRGGDVPENWERTIASCLAEDPSARPASCEEIIRQLEAGGVPAAAPAPAPAVVEAKPAAEPSAVVPVVPPVPAAPEKEPEPAPAQAEPEVTSPVVEEAKPIVEEAKPVVEEVKPVVEEPKPVAAEANPPVEETKPAAEEPKPQEATPAAEEKKPFTEQKTAPVPTRMDPTEIAAKVRREEAEEEARKRRPVDDDDEAYYDRPHGSGPSMMTMVIVVAFLVLVGFLCYKVFFADSATSTTSTSGVITDVNLSTPEPTATPEPATPTPIAVMKPTPEPVPATPPPATTPAPDERTASMPGAEPQKIEAAIAEIKTAPEKAAKELPAVKKVVTTLDTQQQKLADDLKKAETAASEAEKLAADRKKAADEVRKTAMAAAEQLEAKKLEIVKAEEQLTRLELDLKDKERALLEAKATAEAAKQREKTMASATPASSTSMPLTSSTPRPSMSATPAPTPAAPVADDPRLAFEQKMKELGKVLGGAPAMKSATPAPEAPTVTTSPATPAPVTPGMPTVELAKATTPAPVKSATAPGGEGLLNSLGMKLVPLAGTDVLIGIWPARVRDFEPFARTTGLKSNLWKDPGFKQTVDHPVVNVTWQEATAFCKWLTLKEQKEGVISAKQSYRLPTDIEWSRAAGLGAESGTTPEARDMSVPEVYPWGKAWPPPQGAGNYTGEETGSDVAIKGYNDGFAWTSPVGSFPPNKLGLFDMGGNVWQWCMDSWNAESKAKVLRGASWYNGALKLSLLTSCRIHASPDSSTDNYGFRVVLTGADAKPTK